MSRFAGFVHRYVRRFRPIPRRDLTKEYQDEWLSCTDYGLSRKAHMHELLAEYHKGRRKGMYLCSSFVKKEILLEIKEPRIINSRSDMFKAIVGPYVHEAEKYVYDQHYVKGLTPEEIAERLQSLCSQRTFTETDYTRFECSIDWRIIRICEKKVLDRLLWNNPEILRHIHVAQRQTDTYYHWRYAHLHMDGGRMSGDMWTSSMNGFTNQMLIEYMMWRAGTTGDYVIEGDDGVVYSHGGLDFGIPGRLGFTIKTKHVRDINDMSFCGIRVSPSGKLCPNFDYAMTRFGWTFMKRYMHPKTGKQWYKLKGLIKAKALSLQCLSVGMPVIQECCQMVIRLTRGIEANWSDFNLWEKQFIKISEDISPIPPVMQDRQWFYETFGIPISTQFRLEDEFRRCTNLNVRIVL